MSIYAEPISGDHQPLLTDGIDLADMLGIGDPS